MKSIPRYYTAKYITCELEMMGIKMSCKELLQWLQDKGYISDDWLPIKGACPAGTLQQIEIEEEIQLEGSLTRIRTRKLLYFTSKGLAYFVGLITGIDKTAKTTVSQG